MGGIFSFVWNHVFGFFCIAGLIWLTEVIFTQIRYKKRGVVLQGEIIGERVVNHMYFPVYKFDHRGEEIMIDSYQGGKDPHTVGQVDTIYYLEGNSKGVFREHDAEIQLWEIACFIGVVVFGLMDFGIL